MQLKDLESGHIVETKNGTLLLVMKYKTQGSPFETAIAMSEDAWINLGHYNNDFTRMDSLKASNGKELEEIREVVAVYERTNLRLHYTMKEILDKKNLKKIWERN